MKDPVKKSLNLSGSKTLLMNLLKGTRKMFLSKEVSEQLVRKVIKKHTAQKLNEASFSTAWTAGLKLNILNTPLVLMSWLVRVGLLLS